MVPYLPASQAHLASSDIPIGCVQKAVMIMLLQYIVVEQSYSLYPKSGEGFGYDTDTPHTPQPNDAHAQARYSVEPQCPKHVDNPSPAGSALLTGSANLHQTLGLPGFWPCIIEILPLKLMSGRHHKNIQTGNSRRTDRSFGPDSSFQRNRIRCPNSRIPESLSWDLPPPRSA